MRLDHVTIVTHDVEALRAFFVDIVGAVPGHRPAFRVDGHWLYLDQHPAIHLVGTPVSLETACTVPRIDHLAIRIDDACTWQTLIERLSKQQIPYRTASVPLTDEEQMFVQLAPSVSVEFVISTR
jgi:catechol 2,3-dioxygenase-like lactoylglutathione lyase family enzyme